MKAMKLLVIILCLVLLAACSSNKASKNKVVEKTPLELAIESALSAEYSFQVNDFESAISHYNQAIEYYNLALPTSTSADSVKKEIFKIKLNIANIHTINAMDMSSQNDFDTAITEYEAAINDYKQLLPESTPADSINSVLNTLYRNTAVVCRQAGEYEKAIDYYDLYLDANPEDDEVLLQKFAIFRDDLKNEAQAFEILKEYALSKNDFNAYHRLGDLYRDNNDIVNAIFWYEKANSVKADANVLQKLGSLYRNPQIQQWEKSNEALERFIDLNPGYDELTTAYKLIGDNYKNLKDKAKSVEYFEKYINFEYNEDIALYICLYYYDMKNDAKTITWANTVLENNPNNANALLLRAIARYNQKDMKGAKADFERIQNDPKHGKTAQQYLKIIK